MRLTNEIRLRVRRDMIKQAFDKKLATINETIHARAREYYDACLGNGVAEALKKIPEDFLNWEGTITVQLPTHRVWVPLGERRPVPRQNRLLGSALEHPKIVEAIADALSEKKCLEESRMEAEQEADAVLASVRTLKQLEAVWPEAVPFVEKYRPKECTALALPVQKLNSTLGLPPEDEE